MRSLVLLSVALVATGVLAARPATAEIAARITIKPGDTLTVIAKRYDCTIEAVQRANDLHGERILAGKRLAVPVCKGKDAARKPGQARARVDVLGRIEGIADFEVPRRPRHQLHHPLRSPRRDRERIERGLGARDRANQGARERVGARRVLHHLLDGADVRIDGTGGRRGRGFGVGLFVRFDPRHVGGTHLDLAAPDRGHAGGAIAPERFDLEGLARLQVEGIGGDHRGAQGADEDERERSSQGTDAASRR